MRVVYKGTVEGNLVWLEMPEEASLLKPGSLRGKILALFGPLPPNVHHHNALIAANPLAVIHVDERLPFTWAKNDGVYPVWAKKARTSLCASTGWKGRRPSGKVYKRVTPAKRYLGHVSYKWTIR